MGGQERGSLKSGSTPRLLVQIQLQQYGAIAQLGERWLCKSDVESSSLSGSIKSRSYIKDVCPVKGSCAPVGLVSAKIGSDENLSPCNSTKRYIISVAK